MSESSSDPNKSRRERTLVRFSGGNMESTNDFLAVEEPLEIRVVYGAEKRKDRSLSITMRTPGHDRELAAGFMLKEVGRFTGNPNHISIDIHHND